MSTVGDILSTVGRYHDKCGGILEYRGGIMSTVGVILSTVGDVQYRAGYHEVIGLQIFKGVFVNLKATKHTCLFISSTRILSESASLGSHFRKNLQQTHFQLFCQYLALFLPNKVL